jgi:hypothetical protein
MRAVLVIVTNVLRNQTPRMPTLEHGVLLAERKILEEPSTRSPEANQRSHAQNNESKQGPEL